MSSSSSADGKNQPYRASHQPYKAIQSFDAPPPHYVEYVSQQQQQPMYEDGQPYRSCPCCYFEHHPAVGVPTALTPHPAFYEAAPMQPASQTESQGSFPPEVVIQWEQSVDYFEKEMLLQLIVFILRMNRQCLDATKIPMAEFVGLYVALPTYWKDLVMFELEVNQLRRAKPLDMERVCRFVGFYAVHKWARGEFYDMILWLNRNGQTLQELYPSVMSQLRERFLPTARPVPGSYS